MANEPTSAPSAVPTLKAAQVYVMAVVCLVAGLAVGYLFRGMQSAPGRTELVTDAGPHPVPQGPVGSGQMLASAATMQMAASGAQPVAKAAPNRGGDAMAGRRMPTIEEMKHMADKQAEPLEEKLKSDPNNSAVLMQVGAIYFATHQFKQAASYYGKAVDVDPKNVAFRTKLAIGLYSSGDVDGAIAQLNRALDYDSKDANALFDLGMIRLKGKQDGKGAVAAWQQLLKSNPQLSTDRRATVEKLIAEAMTTLADQQGIRGADSNGGHKSNSN